MLSRRLSRLTLGQTLGVVTLVATLLLALAWQSRDPLVVDVGSDTDAVYLADFHSPEVHEAGSFRWTGEQSKITFPGAGISDWQLSLLMWVVREPGAPAPTVRLLDGSANEVFATITPTLLLVETHQITTDVPVTLAGDVTLFINTTPVYMPPEDRRDLGVAIVQATLTPSGIVVPPPWHFVALLGIVAAVALALYMIGGLRLSLVGGLVLATVLAGIVAWQRLWLTPFVSYMLLIAALFAAGAILARGIVERYVSRADGGHAAPSRQVAVAVLMIMAVGYGLIIFGVELARIFNQERSVDFQAMWRAVGRLNMGNPLYDLEGLRENSFASFYKYPPLFAGLLRPIGLFDFDMARTLWRSLNIGLLLASVGVMVMTFTRHPFTARLNGMRSVKWLSMGSLVTPAALGLLFLTLLFRPAIDTLNYGQLDVLILLLMALSLAALRAGRPLLAGPPLALAVTIKLYPALVLFYLAWRREWRALGSFAVALLGWVALGVALTGIEPWAVYLREVLPVSGGSTSWVENQTLSGFAARLLTDQWRLAAFPADPGRALAWSLLTYLAAAIVMAVTLWFSRRSATRQSASYALGFGAVIVTGIFVLPAAWLHYFTLLLLPLAIAFYAIEQHGSEWWALDPRRVMWAVALVGLGALLLAHENIWLIYDRTNFGGVWKLLVSYKLYGELALWAGLLVMLGLAQRVEAQASSAEGEALRERVLVEHEQPAPARQPEVASPTAGFVNKQNPGLIAAFGAIMCVVFAVAQLYQGAQVGAVPAEFWLFCALAVIFGGVWWASRRLSRN